MSFFGAAGMHFRALRRRSTNNTLFSIITHSLLARSRNEFSTPTLNTKKDTPIKDVSFFGAAGRSRTDTRSPSTDFESVASASFTTAASFN